MFKIVPYRRSIAHSCVLVLATLSLVALGPTVAGQSRPLGARRGSVKTRRLPPNSFLNRRVFDTRDLLAQVERDAAVRDRYERHFAMGRSDLMAYLRGLHRAPLAKSGVYTVYGAPTSGSLRMHRETLKKGEPMFVDAAGSPVLVVKCGNPVLLKNPFPPPRPIPPPDPTPDEIIVPPREEYSFEPSGDPIAMVPLVPPVVPPAPPPIRTVPVVPVAAAGASLLQAASTSINFSHRSPSATPEPITTALGVGAIGLYARRRFSAKSRP